LQELRFHSRALPGVNLRQLETREWLSCAAQPSGRRCRQRAVLLGRT